MCTQAQAPLFSHSFKATVDETEYEWVGGFGVLLRSVEPTKLKIGHLCILGSRVFQVVNVERTKTGFFSRTRYLTSWNTVSEVDADWIAQFHRALFPPQQFANIPTKFLYEQSKSV